ncbi:glycosyltransferase [Paraglaciecola sp.]|uniref:glycosyltransferase n=1 Tax=Paraglaciecola sp. TaxID=1920173 RepID=UPI00273D6ADD|nr:glycosyltransferase [Paraglaciecola sp.]MDP5030885.1 glycosyltransferase [Paraglaciecola sp.]
MSKEITKIVIVSKEKFGNTDFREITRIAKRKGIDVEHLCLGSKVSADKNLKIIDFSNDIFLSLSSYFFSLVVLMYILKNIDKNNTFFHIRYHKFCFLFSILQYFGFNIACDVRSGVVASRFRWFSNLLMSIELRTFGKRSVISKGVAEKILGIKKYYLLPLGSSLKCINPKKLNYQQPTRLIYIGTLNERKLEDFVNAIIETNKMRGNIYSLSIFGYGNEVTLAKINEMIFLEENIEYRGFLDYNDIEVVLSNYDIGIAYIPMIDAFMYQPPTKIFEYLSAGLPVIATKTFENNSLIKDGLNGWLVDDNVESLINLLKNNLDFINPADCIKSVNGTSWEEIFNLYYINIMRAGNFK